MERTSKQTEVPILTGLMSMTLDQAVAAIGHGATVVEGKADIPWPGQSSRYVMVALTTEKTDPRAGGPTVYLGLDDDDRVCEAAYSVSMESLGYSSDLTFRQAVQMVHVVEQTLADAGIQVEEGSAQLPDDRSAYVTYLADGTTLARQYASFGGQAEVDGMPMTWFGDLEYDYAPAIDSGNLADTVHIITVGIAEG